MGKEKDVTVPQCMDILRKYEAIQSSMKRLDCTVEAVYKKDPTKKSQAKGAKYKFKPKTTGTAYKECPWCGGNVHARESCPASKAVCKYCQKIGHFEKSVSRGNVTMLKSKTLLSLTVIQMSTLLKKAMIYTHYMLVKRLIKRRCKLMKSKQRLKPSQKFHLMYPPSAK